MTTLSGAEPRCFLRATLLKKPSACTRLRPRSIMNGIDGVALGDPELAPDHEVLGLLVADDVDALDEDARPLLDEEGDGDRAAGRVALRHRP